MRDTSRDLLKKMSLKDKFALWETKAKKDTPKGPTMRPGSRVSQTSFENYHQKMFLRPEVFEFNFIILSFAKIDGDLMSFLKYLLFLVNLHYV